MTGCTMLTVDYTPYEGQPLKAWPRLTLSRGSVVWRDGNTWPEPATVATCAASAPPRPPCVGVATAARYGRPMTPLWQWSARATAAAVGERKWSQRSPVPRWRDCMR